MLRGYMVCPERFDNRKRNELANGESGALESIQELEVQIKKLWEKIAAELHVPVGQPPDLQSLRDAADKLGSGNPKRSSKRATTLTTLKTTRDAEEGRLRDLRLELSNLMARVEEKESTTSRLRALVSEDDGCSSLDKTALCPVAAISIEEALAKGCLLDPQLERFKTAIEREETDLGDLRAKVPLLEHAISSAETQLVTLNKQIPRTPAADLLNDRIDELESLIKEKDRFSNELAVTRSELHDVRTRLTQLHKAGSKVERSFSLLFEAIVKDLLPGNIVDRARMEGNNLDLKVKSGGKTLALGMETVKVLAFDLAAIALSIEQQTFLPDLLIHDSPHVADLGASIYERLFLLAKRMEDFGDTPLFQYILTTTSKPPVQMRSQVWERLQLFGSPEKDRFLTVDL